MELLRHWFTWHKLVLVADNDLFLPDFVYHCSGCTKYKVSVDVWFCFFLCWCDFCCGSLYDMLITIATVLQNVSNLSNIWAYYSIGSYHGWIILLFLEETSWMLLDIVQITLRILTHKTQYFFFFYTCTAPTLFNKFPNSIRTISNIILFLKEVKTWLFQFDLNDINIITSITS